VERLETAEAPFGSFGELQSDEVAEFAEVAVADDSLEGTGRVAELDHRVEGERVIQLDTGSAEGDILQVRD
jgi:hypothetical protein